MIARVALAIGLATSIARADVVAVAPAPDVRNAIVLGADGQVYEPDGHGAWIRRHEGGISSPIVDAQRAGAAVIAGTTAGPPFELEHGVWTSVYLGQHVKAIVGHGARAIAAVGKSVFALDHGPPARLTDAPDPVLAVAASTTGVAIETDHGVLRLDGKKWKPIKNAPHHVATLLDDHWAIVEHGIVDLRTGKITPTGVRVAAATVSGDDVVVVGTHGSIAELVTLHAGKLAQEPVKLDHAAPVAGLAADREGRVLVVTRDGQLALRDHGTWTTAQLRDELPPPRAGSPPALSK